MSGSLLAEAALDYAARGWPIFPVKPLAKTPLTRHGFRDATTDPEIITNWWQKHPSANIGFAVPHEIVVIDVDNPDAVDLGSFSETRATLTPRDGYHFWFRLPESVVIKPGTDILGSGVDVRAYGSYILLPPSRTDAGEYLWLDESDLAPCPEWLLRQLLQRERKAAAPPPNGATQADKIPKGQRHKFLLSVVGKLIRAGLDDESIFAAVMSENLAKCTPPKDESEIRVLVDDAVRRYQQDPAEPDLPHIVLRPGECPSAVDEAEKLLVEQTERFQIFQRGGELVRVVQLSEAETQGGLRRNAGTVMLVPVSQVGLIEIFDQLAVWERTRRVKDKVVGVRVDCPERVAATYKGRIGRWQLPELTGIIAAPILREDGSILYQKGYDRTTGLFLTEAWPELFDNPTRDDALRALEVLRAPFKEFPFKLQEDESVLVSAILTAVQRRLLPSAPLFGFSAPTQRTGKSLLAASVSIIATGQEAPAMATSAEREEIRKAVTASLREGHAVVNLDNVEQPLGSPDLSRAITQRLYGDRILGESRILQLPTNVLWTATGNNLSFRGDLAVRALVCRLDSMLERPEERKFTIQDLKGYLKEHRRELVVAALTILRAYQAAGRPDQHLTPWGGFDQWSAVVRSPLTWLGLPDPCASRKHVLEADPDRDAAAALLVAWHAAVGGRAAQISEILRLSGDNQDLRDSLLAVAAKKNDSSQIDPRRLGWWCREWRDRVVGGLRLEKGKPFGSHMTYQVTSTADTADTADKNTPREPVDMVFLGSEAL